MKHPSLLAIFIVVLLAGCQTTTNNVYEVPDEYSSIIGLWQRNHQGDDIIAFTEFFENGKYVSIARIGDRLIAFEASWWIEDGFLYEKNVRELYNQFPLSPEDIDSAKSKILSISPFMMKTEDADTKKKITYLKIIR